MLIEVGDEVDHVLVMGVFHPKIIDDDTEGDGFGVVFEKVRRDTGEDVTSISYMGEQLVVR